MRTLQLNLASDLRRAPAPQRDELRRDGGRFVLDGVMYQVQWRVAGGYGEFHGTVVDEACDGSADGDARARVAIRLAVHLNAAEDLDFRQRLTSYMAEPELGRSEITARERVCRVLTAVSNEAQHLILDARDCRGLPDVFRRYPRLTQLTIWGRTLTSVPPSIGMLSELTVLVLADNDLTEVPAEIRALTRLEYLNIGCNRITHLPDWLGELPHLRHIDASENYLGEVPASLPSPWLSGLNVRGNRVAPWAEIPDAEHTEAGASRGPFAGYIEPRASILGMARRLMLHDQGGHGETFLQFLAGVAQAASGRDMIARADMHAQLRNVVIAMRCDAALQECCLSLITGNASALDSTDLCVSLLERMHDETVRLMGLDRAREPMADEGA